MKRPKPVRNIDDAINFLGYWARFSTGEMSRHMAGALDVLVRLDCENVELRNRNVDLARKNETLEAKQGGEGL